MTEVAANKRKMKELEDNLLYHLTSTTGSLVEDETLIEALTVTKETAHEVTEKLSISAETEVRINSAREEFRPGQTKRLSAECSTPCSKKQPLCFLVITSAFEHRFSQFFHC